MGEYVFNSPMFSIPMGGADVLLGVQWLKSLGMVAFNFQEISLKFIFRRKGSRITGHHGEFGKYNKL